MTKDNGKERKKKTKGNTKIGNLRQSNLKCTMLLQTSAPLHTLNNPVLFAGRGPNKTRSGYLLEKGQK